MSLVGLVSFLVIVGIVAISSFKANANTVKLLIILCFFQNIYILLLSRWLTGTDYIMLCLIKEILVYLTIFLSFFKKRRIDRTEIYAFAALLVLVLYVLLRMDFSMSVIASFRQLSIPFLFYIFGRSVKLKEGDFVKVIRIFITLSIFTVLFGLIQVMVGPAFFDKMGMKDYMEIKYGFLQMRDGYYIPTSMLSWDFVKYTGKVYLRLASFLVDPVILSQILALAYLLVTFDYCGELTGKRKKLYSIVLLVGVILTLGKGGILITAFSFVYLWGKRNGQRKIISYIAYIFVAIVCVFLIEGAGEGESISLHMAGLTDNIQVMKQNPLGTGIGTQGNMAIKYYEVKNVEVSGESFVGAVMGQMGIIGIVIYCVFMYGLYTKYRRMKHYNKLYNIVFIATNSMWITSFLNNTAVSFTNCFMYMVVLGFSEYSIELYSGYVGRSDENIEEKMQ